MENKQDIKQLIGDAFHEIYNQPMDEQLLSDIFSTSTTHQFLSSNLDYSSDQILNYCRSFKECLKHSFSCPVLHHGEFDCFSHPLLSNASKDKENGDNSSQICGTPLVEINNLFQKFTLIINLYFINKEAKSDKDNNALGRKRKHEDISKFSSQSFEDLPVVTFTNLTNRVMEMLCIHLKSIYTSEEVDEILKYINSSTESNWNILNSIIKNKESLTNSSLNADRIHLNFKFLCVLNSIMDELKAIKLELDEKPYKTTKDNVELAILQIFDEFCRYLANQITSKELEHQEFTEIIKCIENLIFNWNKYFSKIQSPGFDMASLILFLQEIKPWSAKISNLSNIYTSIDSIFESTMESHLFELFIKTNSSDCKLNLDIIKARRQTDTSAHKKFSNLLDNFEREEILFIDLDATAQPSRFLDKFYLISILESRGVIVHDKLDFEMLEDPGDRKICIIPKDLNNHKIICTYQSKLGVINNKSFDEILSKNMRKFDDESVSMNIISEIIKQSSFKLSQNKLCSFKESSRLLAILEICNKWNYVSSIKNLPGHIFGTMDLINQIKVKHSSNKREREYFCDKSKYFSVNKIYQKFCTTNDSLNKLIDFCNQADAELEEYYQYKINQSNLFDRLFEIFESTLSNSQDFSELQSYVSYLYSWVAPTKYSDFEVQMRITSLIKLTNAYHDIILLNAYSTLSDVESIFVLPYKIDRQKYEFEERLNDVLAQSLYNYQLTLDCGLTTDENTHKIIEECKQIEQELKANINRMPEDYENQRGNVKKLLLKLKELYSESLFNNGLQALISWIIKNLSSEPDLDTISYDEAHHKIRSITSACIQLYKLFYNDFGYIIGCFVLSLLSISNDLTTTLILLERLHKRTTSRKLHCKLLSYPDLYDNPLRMLKYTTNRRQIDSVIDSMHMQMQELVRLEVGERRDKDLQTKETDDMKGLFRIAITPQVEHLMKISKSIFDKTKSDKEKEEEQEREEIELNFPTYKNEFDRDKLFDNDPNQNVDYELPTDEPNFLTIRSFRSIGEKKKCFYKLLKTYKALLQKKTSILHQNEDINTMTQSAILIENFQEVTHLLIELLSRPALEKTEETFSSTEAKILNLKIKRCFEALIEESKMNETKITLQVSSKDLPENYNFYEDPNFSEIKLVYAPMIKIIHRCLILLEDWGDHPILVDTIAYCNKVLSLHCYLAPLQKVLTGLELILGKLQEYQKIACKLNTVQDHINTLKLLIIRYRKIQIISWKHMMNSKLEIALVEDFDNFIWLTYALNTEVIKESGTDYDKVFDAVDLYIRDSNLSQFSNRLLHINILRDQIAYASINNLSNQKSQDMHNEQASPVEKKGIANILHFVYMYYTQLKDSYLNSIMKELQNDTETKIKTIIDVSKWSVQKFETSTVGRAYRQLNKAMNGYSKNVLDQNITNTVLKRSREEVISQFKARATTTRNELCLRFSEPQSMINKNKYPLLTCKDLIRNIRRVVKDKIFAQWLNVDFIEEKNTQIISKIIDEWDKKQSSQRRDLNELFKFLKSQGLSSNYKRNIEANRSSKFVTQEDLKFIYSHPSICMQDGMKYLLSRSELYFYKNFEMLIILTSSYQINESIKNYEISSMRNLTSSLYFKLLRYSKLFNNILECIKDNSISNTYCRFKHSIILEQLNAEQDQNSAVESYNILEFERSKRILFTFTKTLEKINCMISFDVQKELDYYQQIYCCLITHEKAASIVEHIQEIKTRINSQYNRLCCEYDEDVVVDLLNELTDVCDQLQTTINESQNKYHEKVVELYRKKLMLCYQSFAKSEAKQENPGSTTHSKEDEKEPGIDEHVEKLQNISDILSEFLPSLYKLESKASESGLIEVSVISFDFHIFLVRVLERCIQYQKSLSKLLYILLSLFIHLTYNGFCGEKDQDDDDDGEGDEEQKDNLDVHDGTGMGEGKGMQNVSDQIEHEEQLEGLKDEQGDPDNEPQSKDKKEEDKFFDMKNDFEGENEEKEEKEEDKDELDSQELDDEMDDVDNKLDNELFNQDNEISSDSEQEDEKKEKENNKQPVDLDKQVDLDHKETEAKGDDQKDKDKNDKPNEQNETELEKENQNDINEQQQEEEKPFVNIDEQIKEEPEEPQEEPEGEGQEEEMQPDEEDENDEEMSVEGQHKFDPTKEEQNNQDEESNKEENDFDIDDLNNMEDEDENGQNDQDVDEELDSEMNSEDENPDQDPDVDADRDQKPDENDKIFASKVNIDKKQDNNTLGNTQEKGEKKEQQDNENQQNNDEQKDYNTEDNDYLFQVMQQFMENKNKEEQKKPKEGERNEDQNMKKAENIEEIDDLPEQADNQDNQDIDGQDFAKDDKAKELRSNVADTVKYNDQEMEPQEDEKQDEPLAPQKDEDEEMSIEQEDKDLDEVKDNDPVKSMIKTNEFYQKYLEEKAKKEEDRNESKEKEQQDKADEANNKNDDVEMEEESEEEKEKFEIKLEKFKLDNTAIDSLQLKKSMVERYEKWRKDKELVKNSFELLNRFKKATNHLSISLCEQMRMILEPTEKSKLKGDYKTGKRINIKKIIPFIASNYRNDKIWLRREMPFKRDYRVLIAIDDSLSMKRNKLGYFALESLVAITEALNQLNVGKVCVCGINDRMNMHMSFEDTYGAEKAAFILSNYSFEYQSFASADTSLPNFMADCNKLLDSLKTDNKNIVFIISDGRFNKKKVLPYIMEAEDRKYLYVFILLDNYDVKHKNSIFNMKSAECIVDEEGKSEIKLRRYLDDFPFKYYTVVQEISHLPKVLSNIFLQWLAMVNS